MASDNVTITEGTSTTGTIAADDVSGVKYQRIKLDIGKDGVSSPYTGTTTELTNLKAGTITKVEGGTIGELGTVTGVGVVADGTISEVGTVTGVGVLADGTLGEVGTVTGIGVLATGTVIQGAGTVTTQLAGTQELLGTVNKVGTVGVVDGGTVQLLQKPTQLTETWGTLVDAAGAEFGTLLSASGAGTYHYIEGCSIVCHSGTVDCYLGYGSSITGTGVIARGIFSEGGGGIARDFKTPLYGGGTNTEVIYKIGGAGTVMYTINYWTGT